VYREDDGVSRLGVSMVSESFALKKDNIKIAAVYDPENKRFIISEKTYELQKFYVMQFDDQRAEMGLE
jgi:hypothetical protein